MAESSAAPESGPTPQISRTPEITDNREAGRYEARAEDGRLAAYSAYARRPGLITFLHTEIVEGFAGQGIGGALARAALNEARAAGVRVEPRCPFIAGWIERHPEYQDLVLQPPATEG